MHAHVHAHVFFWGDTGVQRDYLGVSSLGELSFSSCLKISFLHKGYSGHVCKERFLFQCGILKNVSMACNCVLSRHLKIMITKHFSLLIALTRVLGITLSQGRGERKLCRTSSDNRMTSQVCLKEAPSEFGS